MVADNLYFKLWILMQLFKVHFKQYAHPEFLKGLEEQGKIGIYSVGS